jgi:hypothetical protein
MQGAQKEEKRLICIESIWGPRYNPADSSPQPAHQVAHTNIGALAGDTSRPRHQAVRINVHGMAGYCGEVGAYLHHAWEGNCVRNMDNVLAGCVCDHDQSFVTLLDSLVARRLDSCCLDLTRNACKICCSKKGLVTRAVGRTHQGRRIRAALSPSSPQPATPAEQQMTNYCHIIQPKNFQCVQPVR